MYVLQIIHVQISRVISLHILRSASFGSCNLWGASLLFILCFLSSTEIFCKNNPITSRMYLYISRSSFLYWEIYDMKEVFYFISNYSIFVWKHDCCFVSYIVNINSTSHTFGWLVGCFQDLRRFSDLSAISQIGSRT